MIRRLSGLPGATTQRRLRSCSRGRSASTSSTVSKSLLRATSMAPSRPSRPSQPSPSGPSSPVAEVAGPQRASGPLLLQQTRLRSTTTQGGPPKKREKESDEETSQPQEPSVVAVPTKAMRPSEMVAELDRHIVGQHDAKRAVALALRNRWRRKQLQGDFKQEVMPKNILMIGPTGVGKTEIARRLAKIADAPFIKVEATRYTEVGFHGKDVDTMIADLLETAILQLKSKKRVQIREKIETAVEDKLLNALAGDRAHKRSREELRKLLRAGLCEDHYVTVYIGKEDQGGPPGLRNVREEKRMTVRECRPLLEESEGDTMLNMEDVTKEALHNVENDGIVFIDEIDKICTARDRMWSSSDASAEGVQRDLLPIIEGSTVQTKWGNVQTDHILFIASGAFHTVKPSDMLPELQGRLPVRVELKGLSEENFYQILTEPEFNLLHQQKALMQTEGVNLVFTDEAVREIAKLAFELNRTVENIGARRLHTVIERVMEDIGFSAAEMQHGATVEVTKQMARDKVGKMLEKTDLGRFIL